MDHQKGVLGHDNLVACHGDVARRRSSDAVDPDGDRAVMALQCAFRGDPVGDSDLIRSAIPI
jgi:hypothetical protein